MTVRPFGLSPEQTRVLGALAEKSATTPEAYPLSSNAVRTACIQRSSRDPVVSYDEETVKAAMLGLRKRELAKTVRGAGSRVFKHAHTLDRLGLAKPEIAVLAVLMLRGPQTVGEIKTRTKRQHEFAALKDVDAALRHLAAQPDPLLEQLAREPGQKEARWRHLLEAELELGSAKAGAKGKIPAGALPPPAPDRHESLAEEAAARADTLEEISRRLDTFERGIEELRREIDAD